MENKLFLHGFNTEAFNFTGFLLNSFLVLVGGVADCNSALLKIPKL